eukprot:358976-Chlamydomonas_euryale.AAC.2
MDLNEYVATWRAIWGSTPPGPSPAQVRRPDTTDDVRDTVPSCSLCVKECWEFRRGSGRQRDENDVLLPAMYAMCRSFGSEELFSRTNFAPGITVSPRLPALCIATCASCLYVSSSASARASRYASCCDRHPCRCCAAAACISAASPTRSTTHACASGRDCSSPVMHSTWPHREASSKGSTLSRLGAIT